jgi:uncharacterized protein (TIGR03382 family)
VTAGYGTYSANNENLTTSTYATTAWVPDGSLAIVYAPVATTLTVDLASFSGPVTAAWFDPTTGASTPVSGSPFANSGSFGFATPSGAHTDGTHDWVLALSVGSGPSPDGGNPPPDAGHAGPDAGAPDSGTSSPPADGGSTLGDGGCCGSGGPSTGCGCSGSGGAVTALALALSLAALRRRHGNAPPA